MAKKPDIYGQRNGNGHEEIMATMMRDKSDEISVTNGWHGPNRFKSNGTIDKQ
jgi:hypothetical protein